MADGATRRRSAPSRLRPRLLREFEPPSRTGSGAASPLDRSSAAAEFRRAASTPRMPWAPANGPRATVSGSSDCTRDINSPKRWESGTSWWCDSRPSGAHLFLGLPMHLIANEAIDLELIDPSPGARSHESRRRRTKLDRSVCRDGIADRRARRRSRDTLFHRTSAWRRLVATDGRIALGSLDSEMDCSHRTLIARFRTCVGFPPKTIARLLRFNRAMRSLDRLEPDASQRACGQTVHRGHASRRSTRGCDSVGRPGGRLRILRSGASHQGFPGVRRQHT